MGGFGKDPIPGMQKAPAAKNMQPQEPETGKLRVRNGPCAGREFALDKSRVRIGRLDPPAVAVDIDLAECELGSPAMVSRLHAELLWIDGVLHVIDLGSRNGTWVDEQFVPLEDSGISAPFPVPVGGKIRFANLEMEVVGARPAVNHE